MAAYHYNPLPEDTFRLLTILDRQGPIIHCTLYAFSLHRPPPYRALSYTWGSAIPGDGLTSTLDHTLLCNGRTVPITASLDHALRSIPRDYRYQYIWADAVCINQQDVAERSAQVALMGKIYSLASQVAVWLGPADGSTSAAFDFIYKFAGHLRGHVPEWTVTDRHALFRLFMRKWFSRTWVIQEVVLASDAAVFCGPYSAPWWALTMVSGYAAQRGLTRIAINEIEGGREALETHGGYFRLIGHVPNTIAYLKERCRTAAAGINAENRHNVSAKLLESIILTTRNMRATDPKDKVFAPVALLLHLLPSLELTARLQPDYSKPAAQIFTEVRSFILLNCKSDRRSLMLSVFGEEPKPQVEGLPSWVPDYGDYTTLTIAAHVDREFNCMAGLDNLDVVHELNPMGPRLGIRASQFSTISALLPAISTIDRGAITEIIPWLQFAAALPEFDASGQPAILSMIHCLTANSTRRSSSGATYDSFRKVFTNLFCRLVSRSEISVDGLLASGAILRGLLDDLESRRITAFPTCAQIRAALENHETAAGSENDTFRSIAISGWQLFHSTSGYLGIVRTAAQPGDEIFFVPGHTVPFVFRETDQAGEYELVGEAYVHGVMYGELWKEGLQPEWKPVTLV